MPPLGIFLAFFCSEDFQLGNDQLERRFSLTSLELNALDEKEKRKRGSFFGAVFFSALICM